MNIRFLYLAALLCAGTLSALATLPRPTAAQTATNWLSGGALHNWYSEMGAEREHGLVSRTQYGLQWPGIGRLRDAQVGKGLWLGARNVTDPDGTVHEYRTALIGPRYRGTDQFFPVEFTTSARLPLTQVRVAGEPSNGPNTPRIDAIDADQTADHMITNRVNTSLGVTMERRIMQFAHEEHDNYHVIEYTFTNTGKTGAEDVVTLPDQTVEDLIVFFQWKWSVAAESRYVIGNSTGWGVQTMIDRRGDGQAGDPDDEQFRAQFAWHGHYPAFSWYSPVGGPILPQALPASQIAFGDTLGRLGASHFVGSLTLHADTNPKDASDDWDQPFTRNHFDFDEAFNVGSEPVAPTMMKQIYDEVMSSGVQFPRHARLIEPTGDAGYVNPTRSPALGTMGGYSAGNGYGPYTLAPGESVRIVIAEAAAGLSPHANERIGRQYLLAGDNRDEALLEYQVDGTMHSMTKNEWVLTSRDSLFNTFRNAIDAFESDWKLPRPPASPAQLDIDPVPGSIRLSWTVHEDEADPDAWLVYRSTDRVDGDYKLVGEVAGPERELVDTGLNRELDYYYYVQAVDLNTGLRSNRYFAQSYDPVRIGRKVLHYWSFNQPEATTWEGQVPADIGSGTLNHTFDPSVISNTAGTLVNAVDGADAGGAFTVSPGDPDGWIYLDVPVASHYQIQLSLAVSRELPGFESLRAQYSIDDNDFQTIPGLEYLTSSQSYLVKTYELPDLSEYDATKLRIRFRAEGPAGDGGHVAIDNIRVSGHPVAPYVSTQEPQSRPTSFTLYQNYPNPFNPTTTIRFDVAEPTAVRLLVYNVLGEEVARLIDDTVSAGEHAVDFDAGNLSSGIYLYVIETGSHRSARKMVLVK